MPSADKERDAISGQAEREAQAQQLQGVVSALGSGWGGGWWRSGLHHRRALPPPNLKCWRLDFNRSVEQLRDAMLAIGGNSAAVREDRAKSGPPPTQLAARTERQSISISQAAAAIDQVTKAVREQLARAEDAPVLPRRRATVPKSPQGSWRA